MFFPLHLWSRHLEQQKNGFEHILSKNVSILFVNHMHMIHIYIYIHIQVAYKIHMYTCSIRDMTDSQPF